jgi:UDP-N-acetylglucosamine 2-epimerase
MAVFRAQEERVLHLIEPVWSDSFHLLWHNAAAESSSSSCSSSSDEAASLSGLVRWCSVLLVRAALHSK